MQRQQHRHRPPHRIFSLRVLRHSSDPLEFKPPLPHRDRRASGGSSAMAGGLEGFSFEQRHGKDRVRVARVWRAGGGRHSMVEWDVSISLFSDIVGAYARGNNSGVVATDTMKNTVYVKAKECSEQLSVEHFAILLAKHFTSFYKEVTTAVIKIVEKPWERVYVDGQPHEHGFKLGSEKHTTEVTVKKSGALELTSGIAGLSVLKTAMSGFEGFIRDKYTSLPETRERMLATEVTATWRYSYDTLASIPMIFFISKRDIMMQKKF
ncbi:hypothetical protein NL676_004931 [Syzygium grande]|nr:hypothetical protein NL676_004931 [Syzygium grande]